MAYVKKQNTITIGDSFRDSWSYESDVLKSLKDKLGDMYPQRNRRDIVEEGEFKSGMGRYVWYLIDTTDKDNEKVVEARYAMAMTSKKNNATYYMVSKFKKEDN